MNQEDFTSDRDAITDYRSDRPQAPSATATQPQTEVTLAYQVAMPTPANHLFEVTLCVSGWQQAVLDLKMPVWTPGSYLVREYARHVQDFTATAEGQASPRSWRKLSKNHWQIDTAGCRTITVRYRVYANELTVRTNHLDQTHGYFNGAALFFYVAGYQRQPYQIAIAPPANWHVSTALAALADATNTFVAENFDILVDSPFEIGNHFIYDFEAAGKPHQLAIWGTGNVNPSSIVADMQKIIQVESDLFGGLPYDRYLFLLHLATNGYGGLEHRNSCSLIYHRFGFRVRDKYERFMQLVAHEFFHLWNIKRLRPDALETFDYEQENYTPSLWFSEGTTSYYDLLIPLRAGIYPVGSYLNSLSRELSRYLTTPGRKVQPLSESSFDAWIKLYRQDANSPNNQISYYLKGEMVTLMLDLLIRDRHANQRSFDDVLRLLWEEYGKPEIGFTPAQLEKAIESVAGIDLSDFFERYLHSTEELPLNEYLLRFGLQLQPEGSDLPFTGMTLKVEHGRHLVKFVEIDSPAQQAGIDASDEIIAINGWRATPEQWGDRLREVQPGDVIQVSYFHQDELRQSPLLLGEPRPAHYHIVPVAEPTTQQAENFLGWLGVPLHELI
ncbi:MAG TPA: M61 family metallopeptidase [Leptolyngbyaceae cyanobacterium M33_DOE_097]|uniref:M61 family peptidase n=1 Tax=Oscillatoriales cyanobacterium SpSt-418 TaxID=2282169 RepID=A0A7C3PH88_9CYAN|nr:M61 family metallopeptidase [Leptolyngbyaceae cyanobacterium M33_DOE_097]